MLAIGEERTARLFDLMDDEEIKEMSIIMANLGTVDSAVIERLFIEFADQLSSTGSLVGTFDSTERLLMQSMSSDKVELIMEEIRGPAGRTMWDKLGNVNEQVLANYLKNEYPQTVAVVLSKIKPDDCCLTSSNLRFVKAAKTLSQSLLLACLPTGIFSSTTSLLSSFVLNVYSPSGEATVTELISSRFTEISSCSI